MQQVLKQYTAVKNRDQLRCNAAFFMGILRQITDTKQAKAPSVATKSSVLIVPKPLEADPSSVNPEAKHKLAELYSQGSLDSALMDQHCMGLLAAVPKSLQVAAVTSIAENIIAADNKRGYITQLLKNVQASAASSAMAAVRPGPLQHARSGNAAAGTKVLSNTGKLINPNEVSIRLNPSSVFYDPDLAMCWRVLTRQDKAEWQVKVARGKHPKPTYLSKPRQKLAGQLHPGHALYHAATAAAWKYTDAAVKEDLLHSADQTGEAICLLPNHHSPEPDPDFHDVDFPPLGGMEVSKPDAASGSTANPGPPSRAAGAGAVNSNASTGISASHAGMAHCTKDTTAGGAKLDALPLYNMGMAFQQSLSLQDISQADSSIARNKPLTGALPQVLMQSVLHTLCMTARRA